MTLKMGRILLALLLVLASADPAGATTVTGNLQDLGLAAVTRNALVRFTLQGYGSSIPRTTTGTAATPVKDFLPDSSGNISGTIAGNDTITPGNTYYEVCVFYQGTKFRCQNYQITGASFDLETATPLSGAPASVGPFTASLTFGARSKLHTQASAATSWTINHGFNSNNLQVNCYNNASPPVQQPCTVTLTNTNTVTVSFASATAGHALVEDLTAEGSGHFLPGTATGTVTNPATAPTVAAGSTTGGSLDNTTRYIRVKLITFLGSTLYSPVQTFTPTTFGAGTGRITVNVAGNEWRKGAFGYRVYACTSGAGTACYLQIGYLEELDTTGPLANAHYTHGSVWLGTINLSTGLEADEGSNTATIDADQVALNAACNDSAAGFSRCYGTLQYKPNPVLGYAQTGTTPLVVAWPGTKIRGHATKQLDDANSGSTRNCTFAHVKLGCVMVMSTTGVDIEGLNVIATNLNGYMLNGPATPYSYVNIHDAVSTVSGTTAVAPLRIKGIWYYLGFPNLHLVMNGTGTGANQGAAVLSTNASGGNWTFGGDAATRYTVVDYANVFWNVSGSTDPDSGAVAPFAFFPNLVGSYRARNIEVQWSATAIGQGVMFKGGNVVPMFENVTGSDPQPGAGTGAYFEFGADANAAGGCCSDGWVKNSMLFGAHANNASVFKLVANTAFSTLTIENVFYAHTNAIDMNSLNVGLVIRQPRSIQTCSPNATTNKIINATSTLTLDCSYSSATGGGTENAQQANNYLRGGWAWVQPGDRANLLQGYWAGTGILQFNKGTDPTATANLFAEWWVNSTNKRLYFKDNAGTATLFDINANSGVNAIGIGRAADASNLVSIPNNKRFAALNNAGAAWLPIFSYNTSDQLVLGSSGNPIIPAANGNSSLGLTGTRLSTGFFGSDVALRRVKCDAGTALINTDFALSGGWGAGSAVSAVTGTDCAWQITVTAAGVPGANPTITLTFKDGTWTNSPICNTKWNGGTGAAAFVQDAPTATTNVLTFLATPVAALTYIFVGNCTGRP